MFPWVKHGSDLRILVFMAYKSAKAHLVCVTSIWQQEFRDKIILNLHKTVSLYKINMTYRIQICLYICPTVDMYLQINMYSLRIYTRVEPAITFS